jgi:hypothetical protein
MNDNALAPHPYVSDDVAALASAALVIHQRNDDGECRECFRRPWPCDTARLFGVVA